MATLGQAPIRRPDRTLATIAATMRTPWRRDRIEDTTGKNGGPAQVGQAQAGSHAGSVSGRVHSADEVVWGVAIREGFDELSDSRYHRGVMQHAYLEGDDSVALCGFRPPLSGPRRRRRPRLGLPVAEFHPVCGTCARDVVTARPRVTLPVVPARQPVAVPVQAASRAAATGAGARGRPARAPLAAQPHHVTGVPVVRLTSAGTRAGDPAWVVRGTLRESEVGLLGRGVHAEIDD